MNSSCSRLAQFTLLAVCLLAPAAAAAQVQGDLRRESDAVTYPL